MPNPINALELLAFIPSLASSLPGSAQHIKKYTAHVDGSQVTQTLLTKIAQSCSSVPVFQEIVKNLQDKQRIFFTNNPDKFCPESTCVYELNVENGDFVFRMYHLKAEFPLGTHEKFGDTDKHSCFPVWQITFLEKDFFEHSGPRFIACLLGCYRQSSSNVVESILLFLSSLNSAVITERCGRPIKKGKMADNLELLEQLLICSIGSVDTAFLFFEYQLELLRNSLKKEELTTDESKRLNENVTLLARALQLLNFDESSKQEKHDELKKLNQALQNAVVLKSNQENKNERGTTNLEKQYANFHIIRTPKKLDILNKENPPLVTQDLNYFLKNINGFFKNPGDFQDEIIDFYLFLTDPALNLNQVLEKIEKIDFKELLQRFTRLGENYLDKNVTPEHAIIRILSSLHIIDRLCEAGFFKIDGVQLSNCRVGIYNIFMQKVISSIDTHLFLATSNVPLHKLLSRFKDFYGTKSKEAYLGDYYAALIPEQVVSEMSQITKDIPESSLMMLTQCIDQQFSLFSDKTPQNTRNMLFKFLWVLSEKVKNVTKDSKAEEYSPFERSLFEVFSLQQELEWFSGSLLAALFYYSFSHDHDKECIKHSFNHEVLLSKTSSHSLCFLRSTSSSINFESPFLKNIGILSDKEILFAPKVIKKFALSEDSPLDRVQLNYADKKAALSSTEIPFYVGQTIFSKDTLSTTKKRQLKHQYKQNSVLSAEDTKIEALFNGVLISEDTQVIAVLNHLLTNESWLTGNEQYLVYKVIFQKDALKAALGSQSDLWSLLECLFERQQMALMKSPWDHPLASAVLSLAFEISQYVFEMGNEDKIFALHKDAALQWIEKTHNTLSVYLEQKGTTNFDARCFELYSNYLRAALLLSLSTPEHFTTLLRAYVLMSIIPTRGLENNHREQSKVLLKKANTRLVEMLNHVKIPSNERIHRCIVDLFKLFDIEMESFYDDIFAFGKCTLTRDGTRINVSAEGYKHLLQINIETLRFFRRIKPQEVSKTAEADFVILPAKIKYSGEYAQQMRGEKEVLLVSKEDCWYPKGQSGLIDGFYSWPVGGRAINWWNHLYQVHKEIEGKSYMVCAPTVEMAAMQNFHSLSVAFKNDAPGLFTHSSYLVLIYSSEQDDMEHYVIQDQENRQIIYRASLHERSLLTLYKIKYINGKPQEELVILGKARRVPDVLLRIDDTQHIDVMADPTNPNQACRYDLPRYRLSVYPTPQGYRTTIDGQSCLLTVPKPKEELFSTGVCVTWDNHRQGYLMPIQQYSTQGQHKLSAQHQGSFSFLEKHKQYGGFELNNDHFVVFNVEKNKLSAKEAAARIYLAYHHLANNRPDRADELFKTMRCEGTLDELRFLWWIIKKLPIQYQNDPDVVVIQMRALYFLVNIKEEDSNLAIPTESSASKYPDSKKIPAEELVELKQFFDRLPEELAKQLNRYEAYRAALPKDNLLEEKKESFLLSWYRAHHVYMKSDFSYVGFLDENYLHVFGGLLPDTDRSNTVVYPYQQINRTLQTRSPAIQPQNLTETEQGLLTQISTQKPIDDEIECAYAAYPPLLSRAISRCIGTWQQTSRTRKRIIRD